MSPALGLKGPSACRSLLPVETWTPVMIGATVWIKRRAVIPTWVSDLESEVEGIVDLSPEGPVEMPYVHPDHGGRGMGCDPLDEVEQQARHLGLPQLPANVKATAPGGFVRRGFRVLRPQSIELRGALFRNFVMAKRLDLA